MVADNFVEPNNEEKQKTDDCVQMFPKISDGDALHRLQNNWNAIIENVGSSNPLIMSALHDSKPIEVKKSNVVIEVDQEFKSEIESLSQIRHRQAIEYALKDEIGSDIKVAFKVSEEPFNHNRGTCREEPPQFDKQEMVESNTAPIATQQADKHVRTPREWVRDVPEVKNVLEVFNGMITDIR